MKIKLNNKIDLDIMRDELNRLLGKYGAKADLKFEMGGIRYMTDGSSATMKLTILGVGDNGKLVTKEMKALENRASTRPWLQKMLDEGTYISLSKGTGTLVGYNSRCSKYPYMVKLNDGRIYKVNEYTIQIASSRAGV